MSKLQSHPNKAVDAYYRHVRIMHQRGLFSGSHFRFFCPKPALHKVYNITRNDLIERIITIKKRKLR